jgi:hypothetical protein
MFSLWCFACLPLFGGVAWHEPHAAADFSTMPLMCLLASFQTKGLSDEITSPWQPWQPDCWGCVPPGGLVWQVLPHASHVSFTTFHTGARFTVPPLLAPIRVLPWQ